MQEFIARENIKRFEAQLADCKDPEQREILSRLLAEERKQLVEQQGRKPRQASS